MCAARPLKTKAKKQGQDKQLRLVSATTASPGAVAKGEAAQAPASSAATAATVSLRDGDGGGAAVESSDDSDSDDDKFNPRSLYDNGWCAPPLLVPRTRASIPYMAGQLEPDMQHSLVLPFLFLAVRGQGRDCGVPLTLCPHPMYTLLNTHDRSMPLLE